MVTSIRTRASSVLLVAGMVTMMGGPLVAPSPHEVCGAVGHGCDKIDALAPCCCGDRSDSNPSLVPAGRGDVAPAPAVASAVVPALIPAVTTVVVRRGAPALARPPDLQILFSDLRL
jgi:hypothetical protein